MRHHHWFSPQPRLRPARRSKAIERRPHLEWLEDRTLLNAGDLDPTFDQDGRVTTGFGTSASAFGVTLDPNGKIVAVGMTSPIGSPSDTDFAVTRYNSDGSLDNSFDSDGRAATDFGNTFAQAQDVLIQPDAAGGGFKIVAVGYAFTADSNSTDFAIVRYNSDGSPDTSFGRRGDGIVTVDFGGGFDVAEGVVLQNDGKLVVAGSQLAESNRVLLTRLNRDGSLDDGSAADSTPGDSFGTTGRAIAAFFGSGASTQAHDVALQADGKIVIAGEVRNPSTTTTSFAIMRFSTSGAIDFLFRDGGATCSFADRVSSVARAVFIEPGGTVIAGGSTRFSLTGPADFAVCRLDSFGRQDTTFGGSGDGTVDINSGSNDLLYGLARQDDGKIAAAGFAAGGSDTDFALARFEQTGDLDMSTFGNAGHVTTDFGSQSTTFDQGHAVALQSDGRIIVAGSSASDFAVARYLGDFGPPAPPEADLSVLISDTSSAVAGRTLSYTITVTNAGPSPATGVILTDPLPSGVSFDSVGSSTGCTESTGTVTCLIGALQPGSNVVRTIAVFVDPATRGTVSNKFSVSGNENDPKLNDNSIIADTPVFALADLSLTNIATPSAVPIAGQLTYSLTVHNAGPSTATAITVTDPLPPGVTMDTAASSANCTESAGTVRCLAGTLDPGASASVSIVVVLDPATRGTITNTATVAGTESDAIATNNSATATASVRGEAIRGQKFEDQNGNGIHDPGEPGLDGWTIELVDRATGQVVATETTHSMDVDGDGLIDPETEQGLYEFDEVSPGDYVVREVLMPGWEQTAPSGHLQRVSQSSTGVEGNTHSFHPAISSDGRFVAFYSFADNLVAGDTNGASDVFVVDQLAGSIERVSISITGLEANGSSFDPDISDDGQIVAFRSLATNLVPGDTNGVNDIYIYDRRTHVTRRVSVNVAGDQADDDSFHPALSGNGRFVAFESTATNLVPQDHNDASDIFVYDLRTGLIERVSVGLASESNGPSYQPTISDDGQIVAFASYANNLTLGSGHVPSDTNDHLDIYVYGRATDSTQLVTYDLRGFASSGPSFDPAISGDGNWIAFASNATHLVPDDLNSDADVFLFDLTSNRIELVSRSTAGLQGDDTSVEPSVSFNGRYVAFTSYATNLAPGDTNDQPDIFLHDRLLDVTERINVGILGESNLPSATPAINGDGQFVAFGSSASNLVPNDTNRSDDVFVRDRVGVYEITIDPAEQIEGLDFGNQFESSSVQGQKFADTDGNGRRGAAEVGLDGWTIELVDPSTGRVVATTVTHSIDRDRNGLIDPVTEQGLYSFDPIEPGLYEVHEVQRAGWQQTLPLGPIMFGPAQQLNLGSGTRATATGDFDRDGDLDLAIVDNDSNRVLVLLNEGTGTFGAPIEFAVGLDPVAIVAADFNRDTRLDLAVANRDSGDVSILLGGSVSLFAPAVNYSVGDAGPNGLDAVDGDGDGDVDLFISSLNAVVFLENHGSAVFSSTAFASGGFPSAVLARDLDGDGDIDLVSADRVRDEIIVRLKDGSSSVFLDLFPDHIGSGDGPTSITAADFDDDGDLDLAVGHESSNDIAIVLNDGTGRFTVSSHISMGVAGPPESLVAADLDMDGDIDIAVANLNSVQVDSADIGVLKNVGGAIFGGLTDRGGNSLGFSSSIAAGDLDGDGDPDLIATGFFDAAVYRNTSTGYLREFTRGQRVTGLNFGNRSFRPDIQIRVPDFPRRVQLGETLDLALNVTNAGNATATGVSVTYTLPPGLSFISATLLPPLSVSAPSSFAPQSIAAASAAPAPAPLDCNQRDTEVTCRIGDLKANARRDVSIRVRVNDDAHGSLINRLHVISDDFELLTSDNIFVGTFGLDLFNNVPIDWTPQGPTTITGGQTEGIPGNPVAGAVHAIAAHPTDPNTLYIGAANGGIWKTTDATAQNPTWIPLTDDLPSLSIGALEFDPTDSTHRTLIAGIGRFSSFASPIGSLNGGGILSGVLYTHNGGASWQQLGTEQLEGRTISGVAARGDVMVVAANQFPVGTPFGGGVYRSSNRGVDFQLVSGAMDSGLPLGDVTDLVGDPGDPDRLYAGVINGPNPGVYFSDDAGETWANVSANNPALGMLMVANPVNVEMAVHDSVAGNAVYVAVMNANGQLAGIFRSANQGGMWTAMDVPRTNEGGTAGVGLQPRSRPGSQGTTHFSIAADPLDPNVVYVGGDRQPGSQGVVPNDFFCPAVVGPCVPNSIGALDYSARLFRGDASIPAGGAAAVPSPQWSPLTHVGTLSNSAPHADSREMVFDAAGNLLESDDGGIYRRSNPGSGNITAATNSSPIVITSNNHGLSTGIVVRVTCAQPSSPANGTFTITVVNQNQFSLDNSTGGVNCTGTWGTGDWLSINSNLQITEFHDIAYDANSNIIIGGAQDTGTPEQVAPGSTQWREVSVADGGDVAVDTLALAGTGRSIRYSSIQNLGFLTRRTIDAANNFLPFPVTNASNATPIVITSNGHGLVNGDLVQITGVLGNTAANTASQRLAVVTRIDANNFSLNGTAGNGAYAGGGTIQVFPGLTVLAGGNVLVKQFVTPIVVDEVAANRLLIGGFNSLYESFDGASTISEVGVGIRANRNALAYGGRRMGVANPDVLYAGSNNQVFVRTVAGGAIAPTSPLLTDAGDPAGTIVDVTMDPDDWMTAYAIDDTHVYQTLNGGANWDDITGDLNDPQVESVLVVPSVSFDVILVGGRNGVFAANAANPGAWDEIGTNLPNAPVFDLDYDSADHILVAGTLGRGAWTIADIERELAGHVTGVKWNDLDADGKRDRNEPGLAGWTIYADLDDDGVHDSNEPAAITNAQGEYDLSGLAPGTYSIREFTQSDWIQTFPANNRHRATVGNTPGATAFDFDFGNAQLGGIHGTKWNDIDGDGVHDSNERGLAGWTVFLDLNGNGVLDRVNGVPEPSTVTDSDGEYSFTGLAPGSYTVAERPSTPLLGIDHSSGTLYDVNLGSGNTSTPRNTGIHLPMGITFGANGTLYALNGSAATINPATLFSINIATGAATVIASTGLEVIEGDIDVHPQTGLIYGIQTSFDQQLFTIDPATGQTTLIGSIKENGVIAGGDLSAMAFDKTGTLYVLDTFGDNFSRRLLTVDPATAVVTSSISLPFPRLSGAVAGMDFDPATGKLYFAGDFQFNPGNLYQLDPATGRVDLVGSNFPADALSGLTFVPANAIGAPALGWRQTFPTPSAPGLFDGTHTVTIGSGNDVEANFGNTILAATNPKSSSVSGEVFDDRNGDSIKNNDEPGLAGWITYLDSNGDGQLNNTPAGNGVCDSAASEQCTITGTSGRYSFTNLPAGNYRIRQIARAGWTPTAPASGEHRVDLEPGVNLTAINFGNADRTAPILSGVPENLTANASSPAGAVVEYTLPKATDLVDPSPSVSCNPASGSTFTIGVTTVICSASDDSGNETSASFTVTVRDKRGPRLGDLRVQPAGRQSTAILLTSDKPLDEETAETLGNYRLAMPGRDKRLGTEDDKAITLQSVTYQAAGNTIQLVAAVAMKAIEPFQLTVSARVTDQSGNPLDGGDFIIARGTQLSYVDATGDLVTLALTKGGTLELRRSTNGEGQSLRIVDAVASKSILSGDVARLQSGGNGTTTLQSITGSVLVRNRLNKSQFAIGTISATIVDTLLESGVRPRELAFR